MDDRHFKLLVPAANYLQREDGRQCRQRMTIDLRVELDPEERISKIAIELLHVPKAYIHAGETLEVSKAFSASVKSDLEFMLGHDIDEDIKPDVSEGAQRDADEPDRWRLALQLAPAGEPEIDAEDNAPNI